ncbi:MAG: prepilin-type N-terminal cleavage/methylation domain-containing protein [Candidatus Omnitrophica bacterium]|nr:prepilin-type N-terminal cleavage/methylation domain-containing protein [Candidatus Omnitrophota bacterium]
MIGKKGFTLLELILVVIVIAILATLAVPRFTGMAEKARSAEATNTIGAIKTAEDLVHLEKAEYISDAVGDGTALPLKFNVNAASMAVYWSYGVVVVPATKTTKYVVTATRTPKRAGGVPPAGYQGQTIILTWDEATTPPETWSGSHPGVPKN